MDQFFFIGMIIALFFCTKNVVNLVFHYQAYSIKKKRLNQLRMSVSAEEKDKLKQMDHLTQGVRIKVFPVIQDYLPSLKIDRRDQLAIDLKNSKWDDTFTPESFIAFGLILKAIGLGLIPLIFILPGALQFLFGCGAIGCLFGLDWWFRQDLKTSNTQLFKDFPDFIRIVSGYLSADIKLVEAIKSSIKYVGDGWKPILQQLIIDCKLKGIDYGFDQLRNNVDIFEVKEFVALVRLTLEMGGDVKDGFEQQADKVAELKKNQLIMKIGQRKTLVTLIQAPLLLCNLVMLSLPTFGEVAVFFG